MMLLLLRLYELGETFEEEDKIIADYLYAWTSSRYATTCVNSRTREARPNVVSLLTQAYGIAVDAVNLSVFSRTFRPLLLGKLGRSWVKV